MSTWPLIPFITHLEGFELGVFWVSFIVVLAFSGYFIDMMLVKQGWGPYWDAIFALVGAYGGLLFRRKYVNNLDMYDPYLTIGIVLLGIIIVVIGMTILRARLR